MICCNENDCDCSQRHEKGVISMEVILVMQASMDYATENDGLSALHLAASKGHVEAIQLLLGAHMKRMSANMNGNDDCFLHVK